MQFDQAVDASKVNSSRQQIGSKKIYSCLENINLTQ